MNERIKELAIEAGIVWKKPSKDWTKGPDWMKTNPNMQLEEFAKLIVRECADVMDGRDENGNAKDGQYLLTKFGIDASQRYT
jgi:hypothetical protein